MQLSVSVSASISTPSDGGSGGGFGERSTISATNLYFQTHNLSLIVWPKTMVSNEQFGQLKASNAIDSSGELTSRQQKLPSCSCLRER